jgi:hypothetical protein
MGHLTRMRTMIAATLATTAALVGFAFTGTGGASSGTEVYATYHGSTIDLTQGWQGAHACLVEGASVQCFDSSSQLQSALSAQPSSSAATVSPDSSCDGGTLYLFQNINFGGNELAISSPTGLWINIAAYGFGNQTSSWINDASCAALASKTTYGGGSQYLMSALTANQWIGNAWNDSINSVQLG